MSRSSARNRQPTATVVRERHEAALGPELLEALWLLCDRLLVPRDGWLGVPPLRLLFTTLALQLAVERETDRGSSVRQARRHAALHLGMGLGTWGRRMERWLDAGWQSNDRLPTKCQRPAA